MKEWICNEETYLMPFLEEKASLSHKKVKSLLKYKSVKVNGKVRTLYNYPLKKGDKISVVQQKSPEEFAILYEDAFLIVVSKKEGLLTIATEKETENTLYHKVSLYLKERNPNARLFIVHRLDRETSGIVLFAKTEKVKFLFQKDWNEIVQKRGYTAVVEGVLSGKGKIESYLDEKKGIVYVTKNAKIGKKAVTHYKVIKQNGAYSLLSIELETGRKNQIRVQFASIGFPVVGDKKYGSGKPSLKRMALHAGELSFKHPITHKILEFRLDTPKSFLHLVK